MIENYEVLPNGVIKQKKIYKELQNYNKEYIKSRYNTYGEKGPQMAGIRLGYLVTKLGFTPKSILDVGYGNGDFLKVCSFAIENCFGNDISGYEIPDGCYFVSDITKEHYDVISFFDVLEHFEDINFVKNLRCDYLLISVPWCHNFSDDWFVSWKHRRPDEHLWHFNEKSIENFFNEMGFDLIHFCNIEDLIRKNNKKYENILTCIFKKR